MIGSISPLTDTIEVSLMPLKYTAFFVETQEAVKRISVKTANAMLVLAVCKDLRM